MLNYNEERDRYEIYVSEEDARREPVATAVAEAMFAAGLIHRVDARGRAVNTDGEYTEGKWDVDRERYIPHDRPKDPEPTNVQDGQSTEEPESPQSTDDDEGEKSSQSTGKESKSPKSTTVGTSIRTRSGAK